MGYATYLSGLIEVQGVDEAEFTKLNQAMDEIQTRRCEHQEVGEPARQFLDLPTVWKKQRKKDGSIEEVRINGFEFELEWDSERKVMSIVGTEYFGGTRRDVLRQLNWIMEWIRARNPEAKFGDQISWIDGGGAEDPPIWFEPDPGGGAFCLAYRTKLVKDGVYEGVEDW